MISGLGWVAFAPVAEEEATAKRGLYRYFDTKKEERHKVKFTRFFRL